MDKPIPGELITDLKHVYTINEQAAITGISRSQLNRIVQGAMPFWDHGYEIYALHKSSKTKIRRAIAKKEKEEQARRAKAKGAR